MARFTSLREDRQLYYLATSKRGKDRDLVAIFQRRSDVVEEPRILAVDKDIDRPTKLVSIEERTAHFGIFCHEVDKHFGNIRRCRLYGIVALGLVPQLGR